jgi:hypothetical protein
MFYEGDHCFLEAWSYLGQQIQVLRLDLIGVKVTIDREIAPSLDKRVFAMITSAMPIKD